MKNNKGLRFFIGTSITSIIIVSLLIATNVLINIYGYFGDVEGEKIVVYNNERIAKHLLSYNYIPSNFNALLIGPSLSDNLDVSLFDSKVKVYNGSVMGANISELAPTIYNSVERGEISHVIICLDPYLTKDGGTKSYALNEDTRYRTYGSYVLYQTYLISIIRRLDFLPKSLVRDEIDANGTNYYNSFFAVNDLSKRIQEQSIKFKGQKYVVNEFAMSELKSLLNFLNEKEIKIIGYFHPIPQEILESRYSEYLIFQQKVKSVFKENEILIDFNAEEYTSFRSNYSNYIDHSHLSLSGQQFIISELNRFL